MEKYKLFIYGLVDPCEWDWEEEGEAIAKAYWKQPFTHVTVNVGKYLGLLHELKERMDG